MEDTQVVLDRDQSDDETLPLKAPLISYGADYTLDTMRQYVRDEQIKVHPSFQRNFVWDIKKSSKLIESFLLGYPVPNILLGRPQDTELLEVIDGQQRILSIVSFFSGKFKDGTVFRLTGKEIDPKYQNKTFDDLDDVTQRKLKNSVLKAVIVVYPVANQNIKFTVFQRINTGSVVLNQQEIRNCIFGGSLNTMLISLNKDSRLFRSIYSKSPDKRMRDVETILRFFAAYFSWEKYEEPLTGFLNDFMDANRQIEEPNISKWRDLFNGTLEIIIRNIGKSAFTRLDKGTSFNRAIFESLMVAVAILNKKNKLDVNNIKNKHKEMLLDDIYMSYITSATSNRKAYKGRIEIALKKLSKD